MKKTYIVNGLPNAGKDTFAGYLGEFCKVRKVSVIDPVINIIHLSGLDVSKKTNTDRILMGDLKDAVDKWGDITTKYAVDQHEKFMDSMYDVLLIDVRNPEQIAKLCNLIEAETVLIKGGKVIDTCADDNVDNIYSYKYCHELDNRGTLNEFKEKVYNFYNTVVSS